METATLVDGSTQTGESAPKAVEVERAIGMQNAESQQRMVMKAGATQKKRSLSSSAMTSRVLSGKLQSGQSVW